MASIYIWNFSPYRGWTTYRFPPAKRKTIPAKRKIIRAKRKTVQATVSPKPFFSMFSRKRNNPCMVASEYKEPDTYEKVRSFHNHAEGDTGLFRSRKCGKLVVLKHLHRHGPNSRSYDYPKEAKILLSTLSHHCKITSIFGVSEVGGRYLLALEHCDGGDLWAQIEHFAKVSSNDHRSYSALRFDHKWAERLACPPILSARYHVPEIVILHIFICIADAMAYAHDGLRHSNSDGKYHRVPGHTSVIHCDIKPHNILLQWRPSKDRSSDGMPDIKVGDWGCADVASTSRGVAGTIAYAAPEVLAGFDDPRMDHWR